MLSFLDLINSTDYYENPTQYTDKISTIINEFYNKLVNVSIKKHVINKCDSFTSNIFGISIYKLLTICLINDTA